MHRLGVPDRENKGTTRIAVVLVCVCCSREQIIHIPRDQVGPHRIYWECFRCQEGESQETGTLEKVAPAGTGLFKR